MKTTAAVLPDGVGAQSSPMTEPVFLLAGLVSLSAMALTSAVCRSWRQRSRCLHPCFGRGEEASSLAALKRGMVQLFRTGGR